VYPAVALVAGALCGIVASPPPPSLRWLMVMACALAVAGWWRRQPALTLVAVAGGCLSAGVLLAADARQQVIDTTLRRVLHHEFGGFLLEGLGPAGDHDPILTRGILLEDAALLDGFVSLRLHVTAVAVRSEWVSAGGGVVISVGGTPAADRALEWRAGRTIEAPVTFRRPARYLNDGVPDFERDLALDGTTLFGSVKSGFVVDVVRRGTLLQERAADTRAHVRRAIRRWVTVHHAVAGAIVTAVLIGDRSGLPEPIRERLQDAGTYHVIAISGGNIAILAGLVLGIALLCGVHGRAAASIAVVVLLLYAQIATSGPSVWRATVMASVYLIARVLDQRTAVWQAASVAAAAMVIARPLDVRDPGFVLTFGATVALIEGARHAGRLPFTRRSHAWIAGSLVASLAVELALFPVSAQVFSRVTSAGLLLNLIAVPMMGLAQVAGLVVVAFDAVPGVARIAGWTAYVAARALVDSARLVDLAPWLTSRVPPPGMSLVGVYYTALFLVLFGRGVVIRRIAAVAVVIAFSAIAGFDPTRMLAPASPMKGVRVTMFDVGQGEALLVESAAGALQIDSGGAPFGSGSFDIGARVLAPALWSRGLRTLGTLLLTHGDPDHIGGAPVLLQEFAVERLWEGIEVPRHAPSRLVRDAASANGARRDVRRAGDVIPWAGATIRVLHPPAPDWERPRVRNDDSVVLEIRYGEVALLFTGDVGAEVERAIVPMLAQAPIRILKVGHHGSRTSTSQDLLDAWRPQIALISAGRGNTFGHPAPEVLSRLEAAGARVYRTDRDGQITLVTDGHGVTVRTYVGHGDTETIRH
jgi:competence protein ComEC